MKGPDKRQGLRIVRRVLSADYSCDELDLEQDGTVIREAKDVTGKRRFPHRGEPLGVVSMGRGTVICCSSDRVDWAKATLGHLSRDTIFSASTVALLEGFLSSQGQFLTGPDLKYVCTADSFRACGKPEEDVEIELVEGEDLEELYSHDGFRNALSYRARREVLATVATRDGEILGLAGGSADAEWLWQVGVDVVPACRGKGIGKALVSRLTKEILERERVAYYSALMSNLPSRALAIGVGYWPAWLELGARDKTQPRPD